MAGGSERGGERDAKGTSRVQATDCGDGMDGLCGVMPPGYQGLDQSSHCFSAAAQPSCTVRPLYAIHVAPGTFIQFNPVMSGDSTDSRYGSPKDLKFKPQRLSVFTCAISSTVGSICVRPSVLKAEIQSLIPFFLARCNVILVDTPLVRAHRLPDLLLSLIQHLKPLPLNNKSDNRQST